ncbi:tyrosine recombinase [Bacteroidia bacterium]|nr:tyrosine recombinase [Bacteroidia bacterium]
MKRRSTFNLLFYIKKSQPRKSGLCPVMGRITIDGQAVQFSCKFDIDPKLWDADAGRATGRTEQAREANCLLDKTGAGITEHYRGIVNRDGYVSAEKVKNAYLGMDMRCETLLKVYGRHNADFGKMCEAGSRSKSTRNKYLTVYSLLKEFIRCRYNRSDIALKEIQPAFITGFEFFLRTEKGCCTNTVWIYQMPLRKMITIAVNNGWLVRDLFIFCTFTGFSYSDLKSMSMDNLQSSFDDRHQWIVKRRDKTNVSSTVPVLDIPLQILEKYRGMAGGDRLLPVPGYQSVRSMIKKIAKECGIEKDVHWHMSRHTYATEICLTNGVPIESLAKMMGHKNIKTSGQACRTAKPYWSME